MNQFTHISKGATYLLLASMLFMHVCSAWCSVGEKNCKDEACRKECAEKKDHNKGCQSTHLAFFNTTGQFFNGFSKDVTKAFPIVQNAIAPEINFYPAANHQAIVAYTGFHPPPKAGIRICIQSFLI